MDIFWTIIKGKAPNSSHSVIWHGSLMEHPPWLFHLLLEKRVISIVKSCTCILYPNSNFYIAWSILIPTGELYIAIIKHMVVLWKLNGWFLFDMILLQEPHLSLEASLSNGLGTDFIHIGFVTGLWIFASDLQQEDVEQLACFFDHWLCLPMFNTCRVWKLQSASMLQTF